MTPEPTPEDLAGWCDEEAKRWDYPPSNRTPDGIVARLRLVAAALRSQAADLAAARFEVARLGAELTELRTAKPCGMLPHRVRPVVPFDDDSAPAPREDHHA